MKFDDLGLASYVLQAVRAEGYVTPTPIQQQAIPHLLAGRDLLGCAQTGTGKTAAFALPLLCRLSTAKERPLSRGVYREARATRALILSPTRELAVQIGESFSTYGRNTNLRNTVIFGGVNQFHQVRALRAGVDILVATPGRLLDLMNQGHIDLRSIETFILDEADRMFDMGFLPDLRRIVGKLPAKRQNVMFSATMPAPIEELARTILRDPAHVVIAAKQATIDVIEQHVCFVSQPDKQHVLAELISTEPDARTIVFTRTKHGADRVVKQLRSVGIVAEAIHGNKSQANRQRTLAAFKSSQIAVLVATDVAARGIDIDSVTHVFNFDLPTEPETYVHRVGRTGRAGAGGIAISLCNSEERGQLRDIERLIRRRIDMLAHKIERRPAQPVSQPREESRSRPAATLRHDRPASQPPRKKRRFASIG